MKTKTIDMTYFKSTKGTHVYESDDDACIRTLYIKRTGFPADAPTPPQHITITVEERKS